MIASLPWYDLAEVRAANDELWRQVSGRLPDSLRGGPAPRELDRETPPRLQWRSGRVVLSQACGYDVVGPERDRLRLVATPRYHAIGCGGPTYRSAVIVRRTSGFRTLEDLRGVRCAFNEPESHSGVNGLRGLIAPLHEDGRFFGEVCQSGSHEASLADVREGRADVAAIDCVTLSLLRLHRPGSTAGLRVLAWTRPAPTPPFVTDAGTDEATIAHLVEAIEETLRDKGSAAARAALRLDGVTVLPRAAYEPIADLESEATRLGYPELG